MTDYSNASAADLEKPDKFKFDFIPVKSHNLFIEWVYPEFQSICPISGRHDQGTLTLRYKPREKLLESKSMREYLSLWRNLHNWQEQVTEDIADAIYKALEPVALELKIEWAPRGGIFARTISKKGEDL
jgi:7-cyano-7-deazaguanine reductase